MWRLHPLFIQCIVISCLVYLYKTTVWKYHMVLQGATCWTISELHVSWSLLITVSLPDNSRNKRDIMCYYIKRWRCWRVDCVTLGQDLCPVFLHWALISGWQGKKASAFPKESNYYYYKAFPFSHLTEPQTGKRLGTECSPFMALDVGKEDINTMHGKIIGWEKLLVHSIYHGVH